MAKYPVNIHVKPYSGSDPRKKNEYIEKLKTAKVIEDYLNRNAKSSESSRPEFNYFIIANALRLSVKTVRDILSYNDGGFNGITIEKD